MAIAFDAATENYDSVLSATQSFSHTCTGSDLFVIIQVAHYSTNQTAGDVTYGGANATFLTSASAYASGAARLETWVIAVSTAGTYTVSVTYPAAVSYRHVVASSYTGVDSYGALAVATGSSTGGSVTLTTTVNNSWLVALAVHGRADLNTYATPGSGDTELWDHPADTSSNYNLVWGGEELQATAGSTTVAYTAQASDGLGRAWVVGGIELKPVVVVDATVTLTAVAASTTVNDTLSYVSVNYYPSATVASTSFPVLVVEVSAGHATVLLDAVAVSASAPSLSVSSGSIVTLSVVVASTSVPSLVVTRQYRLVNHGRPGNYFSRWRIV